MEDILVKLNECRKEVLNGLQVKTEIGAPEVLHVDDNFVLFVEVENVIEAGGGGPEHGDAIFRNVVLRVKSTHYASPLDDNGNPIPEGQWLVCPLGDLEEGEVGKKKIGMVATHDIEGTEGLAVVNAWADFDIARYFSIRTQKVTLPHEIPRK